MEFPVSSDPEISAMNDGAGLAMEKIRGCMTADLFHYAGLWRRLFCRGILNNQEQIDSFGFLFDTDLVVGNSRFFGQST